ncbi:MAG TPA: hypothetical protein VG367_01140 [Mucilaginibacter sp.]|jgi:hypothetical protein|nr:hypothetical protein [Mucilaginibacter sp.]
MNAVFLLILVALHKAYPNRPLSNYTIDWFKDISIPITLSIVSAIIFWLVFSVFPERKRRNRIRPKIDLDIYDVYTNLFSVFDLIMRPNGHSPSNYQHKIRGNKFQREDLHLGLQDKCLNELYLYDKNVANLLYPIGKELNRFASKIDIDIEHLFSFNQYLATNEILLLEKIRKKLQVYDLNADPRTSIGNKEYRPVDPSLSYMSSNIFELYQLFIQLQEIVFKNRYTDRNIVITRIQYYFYSDQFKKCQTLIKKATINYSKEDRFLKFYSFLCKYNLGQKSEAYFFLEDILKNKPDLISSRDFLSNFIQDKKVIKLVKRYSLDNDFNEMIAILQREHAMRDSYINELKSLSKYYQDKRNAI